MRYNNILRKAYSLALVPLLATNMYCSSGKQIMKQDAAPKDSVAVQDTSKADTIAIPVSKIEIDLEERIKKARESGNMNTNIAIYNLEIMRISAPLLGVNDLDSVRLIKGKNGMAQYATTRLGASYLIDITNTAFRNEISIDVNSDLNNLLLRAAKYAENWGVSQGMGKRDVVIKEEVAKLYRNRIKNKYKGR